MKETIVKLNKETVLRSKAEAEVIRISKLMDNVAKLAEKKDEREKREDKEKREREINKKTPGTGGRAGNSGGLPLAAWPRATWNIVGSNIEQEVV